MENNDITINGRPVKADNEILDIFTIDYYPENPRINFVLSKYGDTLDQSLIQEKLWERRSIQELADDIERNGGLIEEITVYDGKVIEGNSRLCAYRNIYSRSKDEDKNKWRYIKAKVIKDNLDRSELSYLLGQYHIRGKTPWDAYEKASYLYKMVHEDHFSVEEVAKNFNMKKTSVLKQIQAYLLMRDKYLSRIESYDNETTELKKFSIFEEYFKNAQLQEYKENYPSILNDDIFIEWVREGRISAAVGEVRKLLPKILNNKASRKVFLEDESDCAITNSQKILYRDNPELIDEFYKTLKLATETLKGSKPSEVYVEISNNGSSKQIVNKFRSAVNSFYDNLDKFTK